MNKQITRCWSLCMCLCVSYLIEAQDAQVLFDQGRYFEAAVAYEYDYYQHGNDSALLHKSYCYKALGEYDKALENLLRIRQLEVGYELALAYYLNDQYENAHLETLKIRMMEQPADHHLVLLEVLIASSRLKYEEAKVLIRENLVLLGISAEEMERIDEQKIKVKDPDKAYNISLFLPGIGQWYAGYFGKGLVSGGIQSGIVLFTGWSFYHGYYFSGSLTGAALFYTFYLGGARHARQLAHRKNDEISSSFKQQVLRTIE